MAGSYHPIFDGASVTTPTHPAHDVATLRTYRYLRLGMLAAVAALAYSLTKEYRQAHVHCFLGSISGYYYTPVQPVFVGVMVAIGLALIAIKGRTWVEDACLSFAGMMAPVVALIPTTDDLNGVCRTQMLAIGHYRPAVSGSLFVPAAINNNLHVLVFAGTAAIILFLVAVGIQRLANGPASMSQYTTGTWISLLVGVAVVGLGWVLLHWGYGWVLQGHARAACAMFALLAAAAITNCVVGWNEDASKYCAVLYGIVGALMIISGVVFLIARGSSSSRHLVLYIEATEIALFLAFWAIQTVQRWNETV